MIRILETVTVSLETLYEKFGEELEHGTIEKSNDGDTTYFDLYTSQFGLACMDGETCMVMDKGNDGLLLKNDDGEMVTLFTLSMEEFEYGCFPIRKRFIK